MATTLDRLVKVLRKTYPLVPATATPDLRMDEIGMDSLGIGLLMFDVEDEFQIKFSRDPGQLQTLGDVVVFIDNTVQEQQTADEQRTRSKPAA